MIIQRSELEGRTLSLNICVPAVKLVRCVCNRRLTRSDHLPAGDWKIPAKPASYHFIRSKRPIANGLHTKMIGVKANWFTLGSPSFDWETHSQSREQARWSTNWKFTKLHSGEHHQSKTANPTLSVQYCRSFTIGPTLSIRDEQSSGLLWVQPYA